VSVKTTASLGAHRLGASNLYLGYGDRPVVRGVDIAIPSGKLTVVIGANGSGKSTMLRGLARLLAPSSGEVLLDGKAIHALSTREVATIMGVLPQTPSAPEGIVVADLVGRGRYPHQGWFRRWTSEDDTAVIQALASTGMEAFAERPVDSLSGGQRQRVWIAMVLAQGTELLLLDEPTTYLDIQHQVEVLDLLTELVRSDGRTIAVVLHDLNLACRYADHIVAMKDGTIVAEGVPAQIVTEALVHEIFNLKAQVVPDPISNTPLVVPIGRYHTMAG